MALNSSVLRIWGSFIATVGFKSLNFFEILNSNSELGGAVELNLILVVCSLSNRVQNT